MKNQEQYASDAYIPDITFCKEISLNKLEDTTNNKKSIIIGNLPQEVINLLDNFNFEECSNYEDVLKEFRDKDLVFMHFNDALSSFLRDTFQQEQGKINFHTIAVHQANLASLNYKIINNNKVYSGLHVDKSSGKTSNLEDTPHRLCINLHEDRYLYYVNDTVSKIRADYKLEDVDQATFRYCKENYKNSNIIQIRIPRGSFYIAPTDNLIHDGSSVGQKLLDITLHYLGYFNLKNVEKYERYTS
ncbi:MAG: hypothetical protein ACRBFS_24040 [Aureispira sp.]